MYGSVHRYMILCVDISMILCVVLAVASTLDEMCIDRLLFIN